MNYSEIIEQLKSLRNPENIEGMVRFGISAKNTLGVPIPVLRKMAKEIRKDHAMALKLWGSGIHEARLLAAFIADPKKITEKEMDEWVGDFDSWDVCDQVCGNVFDKTKYVKKKIVAWTKDKREFVRRAGFVLMAAAAVHLKNWKDEEFIEYFPLLKKYATDERNYVKKAINWALRQIGKRNLKLNEEALILAQRIGKIDLKSAKWIAKDAIRELTHPKVLKRIANK